MRLLYRSLFVGVATLAVSACGGNSTVPGGAAGLPAGNSAIARFVLPSNVLEACPDTHQFGFAHCTALVRTGVNPNVPSGFGPGDLQAAYNLPSATKGAGQTVAIVDAFDDPNAESDLAVYRSTYGLSPCTTANGCFSKVNQRGQKGNYPAGNAGWGLEISLDLDMVSAGCPKCNILLVEGDKASFGSLGIAVREALEIGADVVSNSYSGTGARESDYSHPGKVILASSGDGGYGIGDPADFPAVVSVGGTSLVKGGTGRGWTETAWRGTGSGCTSFAKPEWQKAIGCTFRVANDAAAVADPNTGVAVYDTYGYGGFNVVGGTSASSPLLGAVYGMAANAATVDHAKSLWLTKNHRYLYDVTIGSNGTCTPLILCTAGTGWDGPTGWGTPNGIGAF